MERVTFEDL